MRGLRKPALTGQQVLRGQRKPPLGEVLHRRLPEQFAEAIGQRRAREADLLRQLVHRPRIAGFSMQERQRAPDEAIAQTRKPADLLARQRFDVADSRGNTSPRSRADSCPPAIAAARVTAPAPRGRLISFDYAPARR